MKNALVILAVVLLFSSCLKEANKPVTTLKTTQTAVTDSISIDVDGKVYTFQTRFGGGRGNRDANRKLDSISKDAQRHFSADPDTVLFNTQIYVAGNHSQMRIYFFKKFASTDLFLNDGINPGLTPSPKDVNQLYQPGIYGFPLDFNGLNAHNGVAIEVTTDEYLTSYDQSFAGYPTTINSNAQDKAVFKIISIKKERGGYLIEANFRLTLFEKDGTPHKVTNGYLRLLVA
jgi:hypothetical protein